MNNDRIVMATYASYLRDAADREYVSSRILLRGSLPDNFLWTSLHAIEKYLKATLMFNDLVNLKNCSHVIFPLLYEIEDRIGVSYNLEKDEIDFLFRVEEYGPRRYADGSHTFYNDDIFKYDAIIWELRRYCQSVNYSQSGKWMKDHLLKVMRDNPRGLLVSGYLERIIANGPSLYDFQKESLLWNNPIFGGTLDESFNGEAIYASYNPPWEEDEDRRKIMEKYVRITK